MQGTWISELWRYRELVYFLAWRDVKVRYKQAALGAAWAVLQPLLTMVVFTLLFGRLAGIPSDGIPYPLFTFCALVLWIYFSGVITQAGQSLLANSNLLTKVYFPRIVLPVSTAVAGLIDFFVGLAFLGVLMVYYGVRPGWSVLWAPVFLLSLLLLSAGIGLLLAAVNARYRDVKYVMPFLIQLGLFITPVIYPTTLVPERLRPLLALNPMAGIVEGFRAAMFPGRSIDPMLTAVSLTVTVVIFLVGVAYFRKAERVFADIL
jgi:lipopolysaccharide transport system permease protein